MVSLSNQRFLISLYIGFKHADRTIVTESAINLSRLNIVYDHLIYYCHHQSRHYSDKDTHQRPSKHIFCFGGFFIAKAND